MGEAWIGLSEAITRLRAELTSAMEAGDGERIRFELGQIDLEFTVEVKRDVGADAKVRWGLVSGGAKAGAAASSGHRVKLVLQPKDRATGQDVEVAAEEGA